MIYKIQDIIIRKMCIYDGCKNWTGFNYEGLKFAK